MIKLLKLVLIGVVIAALAVVPAFAQDQAGQGGIIVEGNLGGDVATMNPLLASDTASTRVTGLMFIGFLGVDPAEAAIVPGAPGALVEDWTVSEDGTVYTFNLRQNLTWTDGDPIDAADVIYSWDALKLGAEGILSTPGSYIIDPSGETGILDVVALDDFTIQVTFATSECTALSQAASLQPVPSHILPTDISTLGDLPFNLAPNVTSGAFIFGELRPAEQVSVLANPNYPADFTELGYVSPTGFVYRNTPDQTIIVERFLAGELNVIDNPAVGRRNDIRNSPNAQSYNYPGNTWDYLGFNLADPNNPQNAFDESGNPIAQGNHPLFGDVRVRQGIARAVDVEAIMAAATFGEATRMTSFIIPSSWAYHDELAPIPFDVDAANALLDEAGFTGRDGDGIRTAVDALYAEPGSRFEFTLFTNEGNTRRTAIGTLIQDQLSQVGIRVNFQTIDFNTLLDIIDSQTYDTIILGWRNGFPDDPDATQLFTPQSDVLGSGSNFTSFNNARFTELNGLAKNVPGCAVEDRRPFYLEMQEIMQEELPYLWLYAQNGMYAAGANVQNFDPLPSQLLWNLDAWSVVSR